MATEYRNNAKLNVVTRRWREHFPTPPSPSLPPALQPPIALPIFSRSSAVGSLVSLSSRIRSILNKTIAAGGKPIHGILRCDRRQSRGHCLDKGRLGTGLGAAEKLFEFAPHFLDWIEIRGVSRQEQNMGAELLDKPKSLSAFVR